MKLSLAVALLGQTVPTLAERFHPAVQREGALSLTTEDIIKGKSSPQSILDHHDERQGLRHNRRAKRNLARTMKNTPSFFNTMVPCDPKSTDADVGILSCGEDHACQASSLSSLGGLCTPLESSHQAHKHGQHSILPGKESLPLSNFHPQGTDVEECDPSLVDIGILVCGEGQYCQSDEMSGLGGFCLDSLNHDRRLQYTDLYYYLYYCGAYPAEAPTQFCDCSGVNTATGTGTIACSQNDTAQAVQGCDEYTVYNFFSYSFENSALVKINDCYETKTPLAEKICFTYDLANPASDCYTDWNGQRCISCATSAYSTSFNCSNVGGRVGDYWVERLSVFDTCPNSTCTNVCGAGLYIPEVNMPTNVTIGNYLLTCRVLARAEEHQLIFDADCPAYSQGAQTYCCAPAPAVVTTAPTPALVVPAAPAPVVPATPAPVIPATPAPVVPATPAPVVPATPAPVVPPATDPPEDSPGKGGSKKAKKDDTGDSSGETGEPKQAKSDGQRLRA